MTYDEMIDELAATQHGAFARWQALGAGVPGHILDHRVSCGRLTRLHAGVYRVRSHPPSWPQRITAACLASGPAGVASHRAAAYLHGLAGIEPVAEVSVPAGRMRVVNGVTVHRTQTLEGPDLEARDGIPRTRVARTLIDLAGVVTGGALEVALDDALSRRLVTVDYLVRRMESVGRRGRKGGATLTRLVSERADGRPRAQSTFERRLVRLLISAGLPVPQTQVEVALPGGGKAFLDVAYPELLIALEADSYRYHSSAAAWSSDRTRNRDLALLGWLVLSVTWRDLVERPDVVVAMVEEARRTQLRRIFRAS